MKTLTVVLSLAAIIALPCAAAESPDSNPTNTGFAIGQHVPEFTVQAVDLSGGKPKTTQLDSHKTPRATAYIFVGTTCPATNAYAERFKRLEQTYGHKGVDFLYIYPNSNDTSEAKVQFHKDKQFAGRMVDDRGAALAKLFGAQRTSELFLVGKNGIVLYHGAVDDSRDPSAVKVHYLANALDQYLSGKPITTASSQVFA